LSFQEIKQNLEYLIKKHKILRWTNE
jgi:hypothetical protein